MTNCVFILCCTCLHTEVLFKSHTLQSEFLSSHVEPVHTLLFQWVMSSMCQRSRSWGQTSRKQHGSMWLEKKCEGQGQWEDEGRKAHGSSCVILFIFSTGLSLEDGVKVALGSSLKDRRFLRIHSKVSIPVKARCFFFFFFCGRQGFLFSSQLLWGNVH